MKNKTIIAGVVGILAVATFASVGGVYAYQKIQEPIELQNKMQP